MGSIGRRGGAAAAVEAPKVVRNTERSLTEIEIALAECDYFNYVKNVVAFNVLGESSKLSLWHECDMLVLRPSGYLLEVEIKRSWSDFLADFHKTHHHRCNDRQSLIKELWFCIPEGCLEDAKAKLKESGQPYSGIVTYDENLKLTFHGGWLMPDCRKLTEEERFQVARFGAMRCVKLRKKLIQKKSPGKDAKDAKIEELEARISALVAYVEQETGQKLSRKDLNDIYYG